VSVDYNHAARVIAFFELFRGIAYWDVNAWRIGYGSDTRTAAQIKVRRGDGENEADAIANLATRIPEFEATISDQIGKDVFENLPRAIQSAALSFAYNYGELTPSIASAMQTHASQDALAKLFELRASDNNSVNHNRRMMEAGMILGA